MSKKSQINQVFIYLASIIMILFVGFLAVKFITSFDDGVDDISEQKFYDLLEEDFSVIYRAFGSEKVQEYRLTRDVELVCFVEKPSCISSLVQLDTISDNSKQDLSTVVNDGNNVVIFSNSGIKSSSYIGDFQAAEEGCFCIQPLNNRINLVIENKKNIVFLNEP